MVGSTYLNKKSIKEYLDLSKGILKTIFDKLYGLVDADELNKFNARNP
jgi:hypothetical protein